MFPAAPSTSDAELLFLRSDTMSRNAIWMIIGGVAVLVSGVIGFGLALILNVDQISVHFMSTMPILAGLGLLWAGISVARTPNQVSVGPDGIRLEGNGRRQGFAWDQIGWATVGMPGMGGRRMLLIYDTQGKQLAGISDAFDNFDALVELVKARVEARPDDTASRLQKTKARRSSLICLVTGLLLMAASISIGAMTFYEQRAQKVLDEKGVPGLGQIARRFTAPNGVTRRIEYQVKTEKGLASKRNVEVEPKYWAELEGATTVPVMYVPEEPDISRLVFGEVVDKNDPANNPIFGYGLTGGGLLVSLVIFSAGVMQWFGWDIDLDSKTGRLSIKRFGAGK